LRRREKRGGDTYSRAWASTSKPTPNKCRDVFKHAGYPHE